MNYKNYFAKLLLEQERPRHDSDPNAIQTDFLEPTSDPNSLDTEGLPEGAMGSLVEKIAQQIIADANELTQLAKRLIDPNDPNAILTKLASDEITSIPEFRSAAETAAKSLKKAQPALQAAVTDMNVLATLAKTRRDDRISKETGPSGPR